MLIVLISHGEALWQTIRLIIVFILILLMSYYATKFVAKYQSNALGSKRNMQIVESMRLGNNKFLAVVKIGEEYYALGLGKDEVTLIDKLPDYKPTEESSLSETGETDKEKKSFKEVLAQFKDKK